MIRILIDGISKACAKPNKVAKDPYECAVISNSRAFRGKKGKTGGKQGLYRVSVGLRSGAR